LKNKQQGKFMNYFSSFILGASLLCTQATHAVDKKSVVADYWQRYLTALKADVYDVGSEFGKLFDAKTLVTIALIIAIAYPTVELTKNKSLVSVGAVAIPALAYFLQAAIARLAWPFIFAAVQVVKQPINALNALDK
jgi:hypothetical protein